jgi:hypothetical protein
MIFVVQSNLEIHPSLLVHEYSDLGEYV